MKTLKCDMCDHEEQGETFEDWMKTLMTHYYEAHPEVMNDSSKTDADMQQWMTDNKMRFEEA